MPAGVNGYSVLAAGQQVAPNAALGGSSFGIGATGEVTVRTGTNARVAGMLLVAGAILAALKLSGFRFNVGVTN